MLGNSFSQKLHSYDIAQFRYHVATLCRWGGTIDTISEANLQDSYIENTAYRWCVLGFVPIVDTRWKPVTYGHGDSSWYYCSKWDVRYDLARAKELLKTGLREYDRLPDGGPYDGHPCWQAKNGEGQKPSPLRQRCRPAYLRVL